MALSTYTDVKAALGDWLHRSDITSQADDFIDLFETDFNASVRARQMEARTSTPSTAGYLLHPTNWLGWKGIRGTNGNDTYYLEPVTDETAIRETGDEGNSATPKYYKVEGSKTYLYPPPATAVTFTAIYWEGVALSSTANWLLTSYPGAYLYGGLLQATAYVGDDPRVPLWQSAYSSILDKIKSDSRKSEWSGQALQMKSDTGTP